MTAPGSRCARARTPKLASYFRLGSAHVTDPGIHRRHLGARGPLRRHRVLRREGPAGRHRTAQRRPHPRGGEEAQDHRGTEIGPRARGRGHPRPLGAEAPAERPAHGDSFRTPRTKSRPPIPMPLPKAVRTPSTMTTPSSIRAAASTSRHRTTSASPPRESRSSKPGTPPDRYFTATCIHTCLPTITIWRPDRPTP